MNNFERIKAMNIEEMVSFIRDLTNDEYTCSNCNDEECNQSFFNRNYDRCNKGVKKWLESEVE